MPPLNIYGLSDFMSEPPPAGWPVAAAEPGGDELCSMAPVEGSPLAPVDDLVERSSAAPDPAGAELCSCAPVEGSLDVVLPGSFGGAD